jgi:hypothetical protein
MSPEVVGQVQKIAQNSLCDDCNFYRYASICSHEMCLQGIGHLCDATVRSYWHMPATHRVCTVDSGMRDVSMLIALNSLQS